MASLRPQPNDRQRNSHQDQCDLPAFSVAPQAGHHRYFPDDSEFPCAHLSHYAASAEILAIRRQFLLPLPPITSCRHRFGCRSAQPPAVPDRNMTISNWRTAQPPITFVPIHEGTHAHHPTPRKALPPSTSPISLIVCINHRTRSLVGPIAKTAVAASLRTITARTTGVRYTPSIRIGAGAQALGQVVILRTSTQESPE